MAKENLQSIREIEFLVYAKKDSIERFRKRDSGNFHFGNDMQLRFTPFHRIVDLINLSRCTVILCSMKLTRVATGSITNNAVPHRLIASCCCCRRQNSKLILASRTHLI